MIRTRIILFASVLLLCGARSGIAAKRTVSYFSANILYCDVAAGEKRADYVWRREGLIEVLAKLKPDVIGIQEAAVCRIYGHPSGDDTIKEIAKGLKKRGLNYGASFYLSESVGALWLEGLAFMWNKDTVSLDAEHIKCRHLGDSYKRSGALIQKSLCRAEAQPVGGGDAPLFVYNTHLEAYDAAVRDRQAAEVRGILEREAVAAKRRALFGGDLNSDAMRPVFETGGFRQVLMNRVDYIFSNAIPSETIKSEVVPLHSIPEKQDISDHNGILVTVPWR